MTRVNEFLKDIKTIILKRETKLPKLLLLINYIKVSLFLFFDGRIFSVSSIKFLSYKVEFVSYTEFFMLVRELFVQEPYFFDSEVSRPCIIDCGSNIGMATLYFKYCYPEAEIIAFEPDPLAFNILQKNIEQNNRH